MGKTLYQYQCPDCGARDQQRRAWCEMCGGLEVMPLFIEDAISVEITARDRRTALEVRLSHGA